MSDDSKVEHVLATQTLGRALRDIERELREIRVLLEALYQHLGGEGKRR